MFTIGRVFLILVIAHQSSWIEAQSTEAVGKVLDSLNYDTLKKKFDIINDYLVDTTDSDDVALNMAAAKDWLISNRIERKFDHLRREVEVLLALDTVVEDNRLRCTELATKVLEANLLGTDNRAAIDEKKYMKNSCPKLLDIIVKHYGKSRGSQCKSSYSNDFKSKLMKSMDPIQVQAIESIARNYVGIRGSLYRGRIAESNDAKKYQDIVEDDRLKNSFPANAQLILSMLESLSLSDPNAKYLKRQPNLKTGLIEIILKKFDALYDKYMDEPCRNFTSNQTARDIFVSASFDLKWVEFEKASTETEKFYQHWAAFQLCDILVNQKKQILPRISTMAGEN